MAVPELLIWSVFVGALVTAVIYMLKAFSQAKRYNDAKNKAQTTNFEEPFRQQSDQHMESNDCHKEIETKQSLSSVCKVTETDNTYIGGLCDIQSAEPDYDVHYEKRIHASAVVSKVTVADESTATSGWNSSEVGLDPGPPYYAMIACSDKLTSTLSADPLSIATILVSRGFIPPNTEAEMRIPSFTGHHKASILVEAVRNKVKINPKRLNEFIVILQEQPWTREIAESLHSSMLKFSSGDTSFGDGCDYLSVYVSYLKALYGLLTPTENSHNQWPPALASKYFRLTMIAGDMETSKDEIFRMLVSGNLESSSQRCTPIELSEILNQPICEGKQRVVLIEGAPGSGKTTLTVYICQQWGKGELFQKYKIVILVQLRDPEIMSAKSVKDLLPHRNNAMAEKAYDEVTNKDGQGVLWIFDGWDEVSTSLPSYHVVRKLIETKRTWRNPLPKSHVILTSRPIQSGGLHQVVSHRIELLGFLPSEQKQYFSECLDGDEETVKALTEKIIAMPAVSGSCYLPLNASILVFLCKCKANSLPSTQYEIFSALICNCILRYCKQTNAYNISYLKSLAQLPDVLKKSFCSLCELAYCGIMKDQVTFVLSPDFETLGLLYGVESLTNCGAEYRYNFIHLSIQELLAAFYIAESMHVAEQVSIFRKYFHYPRFSAVFQHFAAITKLNIHEINDSITTITQWYSTSPSFRDESLLLSLLHCAYEAQDSALCQLLCKEIGFKLSFNDTHSLTPIDCNVIGYFISQVCIMHDGNFDVSLTNSSIIDVQGWKFLTESICKHLHSHYQITAKLKLNLICQGFTVGMMREVVNPDPHVNEIPDNEIFPEEIRNNLMLSHLSTLLKSTQIINTLNLGMCGFTAEGCRLLSDGLMSNTSLEVLHMSVNRLYDQGILKFVPCLEFNGTLRELYLQACGITDIGMIFLIQSLAKNETLQVLDISCNPGITAQSISLVRDFLCQNDKTALSIIYVSKDILEHLIPASDLIDKVRSEKKLHIVEFIVDHNDSMRFFSKPDSNTNVQGEALESNASTTVELVTMSSRDLKEVTISSPVDSLVTHLSGYGCGEYSEYLKTLYLNMKLPLMHTQSSSFSGSNKPERFQLAKVISSKRRVGEPCDDFTESTITGKLDDILEDKEAIELADILGSEHGRAIQRTVLLLGAHGSGKSTACIHICQQWAMGYMFSAYNLVILIQLHDPFIHNATKLADLIPSENGHKASKIAAEIEATKGENVLWILDGWDKLPQKLCKCSFLHMLVTSKESPISKSAIIVTCRPSCNNLAPHCRHPLYQSQVELLGFTSSELQSYFEDHFHCDSHAAGALLDKIQSNQALSSICNIPLYASILGCVFKSKSHSSPSTEYDLILKFVLLCLSAFEEDTTQTCLSLENIPSTIIKSFNSLCKLAFQGVINESTTFDLPPNYQTLRLLQPIECIIRPGKVLHQFIHHSVQYLLAARYIAVQIKPCEQGLTVKELFDKSQLNSHCAPVLQFYASMTKLKVPGICPVLKHIAMKFSPKEEDSKLAPISREDEKLFLLNSKKNSKIGREDKILLLLVICCLHEAQDPLLCQLVASTTEYKIDLSDVYLYQSVLLSIAFFIRSIFSKTVLDLNFMSCCITKEGCECFISEICNGRSNTELSKVNMNFFKQSQSSIVSNMFINMIKECSDFDDSGSALKSRPHYNSNCYNDARMFGNQIAPIITHYLCHTNMIYSLNLGGNGLTSKGAWHLSNFLSENTSLIELMLNWNFLGDEGVQSITRALQNNNHLKILYMQGCQITDKGFKHIAQALSVNKCLELLSASCNGRVTSEGLSAIIDCLCTLKNSTLEHLYLPQHLETQVNEASFLINETRRARKLSEITMEATDAMVF